MSGTALVNGSGQPEFIDDAEREDGRNGKAATARIMARIVRAVNEIANAGHPMFSWIQRGSTHSTVGMRQVLSPRSLGLFRESGVALYLTHPFDPDGNPGFITGQGINLNIGGTDYLTRTDYDDVNDTSYPIDLRVASLTAGYTYSTAMTSVTISSTTDNAPQLRSGSIWQSPSDGVVVTDTGPVVGSSELHPKGFIVGERSGSNEGLDSLIRVFNNAFYYQRPQIGWSTNDASTNYADFSTSTASFRYIFDQSYGSGGTAFSTTSPAITLPLSYAAAGRRTQIRVYPFVYACMSGTTNTGTIGVANKDANGTMSTVATALTHASTISGTTFQWYPAPASFNPATSQYFRAYASAGYDRVALCAKSSGTVNSVRIGAWTFIIEHSVL